MRNIRRLFIIALLVYLNSLIPWSNVLSQGCDDITDHFQFSQTDDYYAVVLDSVSSNCQLEPCDEIGVYDGDLCVGASVFQGQWPLAMKAWRDDTQTSVLDGYISGNPMTFKIWYSSGDSEIVNFDVIYESGDGTFDSGPFAKLSLLCCNPPSPPTSFSTRNGCNSVTCLWGAVQGADGYCVYINGDSVWCGTETSHEFTGLEPVVHIFAVASYNECGRGEQSAELETTPLAIPEVPSWCSVSDDNCDYISITWENVDRDGGYIIYRDGESIPIDTTGQDVTSYVDSVTGQHEYSVSAFNTTCGESEKSEIATGIGKTSPMGTQPVMNPLVNKIEIDWLPTPLASTYELIITPPDDTIITDSETGYSFDLPTDAAGLAQSGLYCVELTCLNDCGRSNTLTDTVELYHIGGHVHKQNVTLDNVWVFIGSNGGSALSSPDVDSTITNPDGNYRFVIAPGTYSVWRDSTDGDIYRITVTDEPVEGKNFNGFMDVREIESPELPKSYSLDQNYPNPFNPSTTIEFKLPRRSQVNIDIFNLLGQKVFTLLDQGCSAGSYRVDWDGSTDLGRKASTGVYFYRIRAEGYTATKKMIMLK